MPATIKDIAKKTGLGLATISAYLNGVNVREKNKILIEKAIKDLDFEVNELARGLKTNTTKTIGIIIPELSNIFCTEIITIMEDIFRSHGYAAIVCDCRTDPVLEQQAVEFLLQRRVDGIINIPVTDQNVHLKKAQKKNKPIVLIDRHISGIECDCVLVDNVKACEQAVQHLIEKNHIEIGIIVGPQKVFTAHQRLQGYKNALKNNKIKINQDLILSSDLTIDGGSEALKLLIKNNPDMSAVIVTNYEMTIGAVIAINDLDIKVPQQLSVIGFDNINFAKATMPQLSIVTQPLKEIAENTAHLMLERLAGDKTEFKAICLDTSFFNGNSIMPQINKRK